MRISDNFKEKYKDKRNLRYTKYAIALCSNSLIITFLGSLAQENKRLVNCNSCVYLGVGCYISTLLMNSNLIFLTDDDLDKPIYRIFSFDRLREIFDENMLTLVKPIKWDDPFENFILKAEGQMNDGRRFGFDARNHFYGQCWSLTRESDAMWRIYSPNKDGVKVKTTIRKLFTPFFNLGGRHHKANGDLYNLSCFIGKVSYKSTKFLLEMLNDKVRMTSKVFDQSGWGQASTFLFKRWAFRHEHEVRLLYFNHGDISSDLFKFPTSPNEVFDEIVFDPRMKKEIYQDNKSLVKTWGYQHKIIQSGLYKLLDFKIKVDTP